jgi:hypothetical protein
MPSIDSTIILSDWREAELFGRAALKEERRADLVG